MNKICLVIVALICAANSFAQNSLKIKVLNGETKEPLTGASAYIQSMENGSTTDSNGIRIFKNLPVGKFRLMVTHIGFTPQEIPITIPFSGDMLVIEMEQEEEEEE